MYAPREPVAPEGRALALLSSSSITLSRRATTPDYSREWPTGQRRKSKEEERTMNEKR
jgi:hypothetical protein